jgi:translation initiation factor 1
MGRLFAGTPWDRPPRCDRCGQLESECACPPPDDAAAAPTPPGRQTARLRVEKRPRGKVVTCIRGLDPAAERLEDLSRTLKARCGTGGTVKDGTIELQGDHREAIETTLVALGYKVRNG